MSNIVLQKKIEDALDCKRLETLPDHLYYNVVVSNNQSNNLIKAEYVDNRASAILKCPNDYYCAITRFKIPITNIPLMIFRDNYYYIQISYGGVNYPDPNAPTFVNYISEGKSSDGSQTIFTLQQFIDCVNKKIRDLYILVSNANPLDATFPRFPQNIGGVILFEYVPYITYDPVTSLFTFHAWSAWGNVDANGNGNPPPFKPPNPAIPQFFMNTNLSELFLWQAFGDFVFPLPQDTTLMYFKDNKNNLDVKQLPDPLNPALTVPVTFYNMQQEEVTIYLFSELQSIVFLSNSLGARSEQIPSFSNSVNIGQSGNSADNSLTIITDFEPLQSQFIDRGYFQFFQTGPYKYIDFQLTNEVRNLKINAFWVDKSLVLRPIYLASGQVFTMKILFVKKKVAISGK